MVLSTTSKPITKAEVTIYADLQDKAPPRVRRVTEQALLVLQMQMIILVLMKQLVSG